MKRTFATLAVAAVALTAVAADSAYAQIGVGIGLAAIGDNVNQAGGELADVFRQEGVNSGDLDGNLGFYVTGRFRLKVDPFRLIGDVSYVYFPTEQVTLTNGSVNAGDSTVSGTFDVGTTFIPIAAGATFTLPIPVVKPYVGAQASYTFISRTYTFVRGGQELEELDINNRSAGDPEAGLTLNAGVEFDLSAVALDVGLRYNMMNLFTMETNEKAMRYLQVGASLMF